jgi:uncharacterized protein YcgL (UPF0745 family)
MLDWLGLDDDDDGRDYRRTLGIRDKQILYRNAKGRCQNPGCNRKIGFDEMQVGHKTAWSKRGSTTLANSACLCYRCNKLQGTDSWVTFLKKQGIEDPKAKETKSVKQSLEALTLSQLKSLAREHHVEVRGKIEEDGFTSRRIAPPKSKYVQKLSKILTKEQLISVPKEAPKTVKKAVKKKRRTRSKDSWLMSLQRVVDGVVEAL